MINLIKFSIFVITSYFFVYASSIANASQKLTVATWVAPTQQINEYGFRPFASNVESITDSRLSFRFIDGGALLDARSTLSGLRDGVADIGMLTTTYYPAEFPRAQLISDLAFLTDDPMVAVAAKAEFFLLECNECINEFVKQGVFPIVFFGTNPYAIITKKEITTLDSLNGMKMRSPGSVWDSWIKSVGGVPVHMTSSEMFEALDGGAVDAVLFTLAGLRSNSLWDVANYALNLPVGSYSGTGVPTISLKTWKTLSNDDRKAILESAPIGGVGTTYGYDLQDRKAAEEAEAHGVRIYSPTDEMLIQLEKFKEQELKNLRSGANEKYGITDGDKMIDRYSELVEKWTEIIKEVNGDRYEIIKKIRKDVISKVDVDNFLEQK